MKFRDSGYLMSSELENKISYLDGFKVFETKIKFYQENHKEQVCYWLSNKL